MLQSLFTVTTSRLEREEWIECGFLCATGEERHLQLHFSLFTKSNMEFCQLLNNIYKLAQASKALDNVAMNPTCNFLRITTWWAQGYLHYEVVESDGLTVGAFIQSVAKGMHNILTKLCSDDRHPRVRTYKKRHPEWPNEHKQMLRELTEAFQHTPGWHISQPRGRVP